LGYQQFLNSSHFKCLDGIRALSILAVIWHHTAAHYFDASPLANSGYHGVSLFFVISGFLITSLIIREKNKNGFVNLKKFYIRRSLRIFPLYYAVLLVYIVAVAVIEGDSADGKEFFSNLPYYLTYTSNVFVPLIFGERIIFYFAWSLAVEEQFYLVWPWFERYLKNKTLILISVLLIMFLVGIHFNIFLDNKIGRTITDILVIPISLGVLLAHILHLEKAYISMSKILAGNYLSLIYLFIVLLLLSYSVQNILIYLFMALFLGSCVIAPNPILRNLLENKAIIHLGKISYGMYLMHMLSYNAVKLLLKSFNIGHWLLYFSLTVIVTTIVATLSFYTFEKYFMNLKKRYGY
jgi:peptidoglycan/LPS O-acetylase OafA/YrhL